MELPNGWLSKMYKYRSQLAILPGFLHWGIIHIVKNSSKCKIQSFSVYVWQPSELSNSWTFSSPPNEAPCWNFSGQGTRIPCAAWLKKKKSPMPISSHPPCLLHSIWQPLNSFLSMNLLILIFLIKSAQCGMQDLIRFPQWGMEPGSPGSTES